MLLKKVISLVPLKDSSLNLSFKIFNGICSCGETYIDKAILNVEEFWSEHNSVGNKPKPVKNLVYNEKHSLLWSILCATPGDGKTLKNLEALLISKMKPSLNR